MEQHPRICQQGIPLCCQSSTPLLIAPCPSYPAPRFPTPPHPPCSGLPLMPRCAFLLQAGVKHVILTLGSAGAALCTLPSCGTRVTVQHLPAAAAQVVNTNGAGDCLVAGCLACLLQGSSAVSSLAFGMVSRPYVLKAKNTHSYALGTVAESLFARLCIGLWQDARVGGARRGGGHGRGVLCIRHSW